MLNLQSLNLFVVAVRAGSFSAAGRQIGLSPASVSRHINLLEDELGIKLINRNSRSISLTEAGQEYFERGVKILTEISSAQEALEKFKGNTRGRLRVHSRISIGEFVIAPALHLFLSKYPSLTVELMLSNDTAVDIVRHNIDVDIRIGKLDDSALIVRQMVKGERIVCASPDYLRRRGTPLHPNELPQHSCLAYRPNLADSLWRFRGPDGALIELKAGGNLQTDNGFVLRSCLLQGAGIALMPDWSVSRELKNGQIVRIFEAYSVTPNEFENGVFAVYQSSRHDSPKLQAFLDFVAKLFKELAVPGSTAERSQISASLDAS